MTFSFIIIMNFTIIIIRMTALSFRHSSYCTSEKAMEEKSRRTAVSWFPDSLCINVCWENRGISSPVQLGKSSWSPLICSSSPTQTVSCIVSFQCLFTITPIIDAVWRSIDSNSFEGPLKNNSSTLKLMETLQHCAPPRCDEEWTRHFPSAYHRWCSCSCACASMTVSKWAP